MENGAVVVWGDSNYGGEPTVVSSEWSSSENAYIQTILKNVEDDLKSGVVNIYSNYGAFAALKNDGSVVTWGNKSYGADSSSVESEISDNVKEIKSSEFGGFKAIKNDGSSVSWGNSYNYNADTKVISSDGYIFELNSENDQLLSIQPASFTGSSDYFGGGGGGAIEKSNDKKTNKGKKSSAKKSSGGSKKSSAKKSSGSKKSSAKKPGGGSKKSSAKKSSGGGKKKK